MPKVNVYLPDDLYQQVRSLELPLSSIAQEALRREVSRVRNAAWIAAARARAPRVEHTVDTRGALDEARDEFGA